jgi:hypothetical protein
MIVSTRKEPDQACAEATDLARAAAEDMAGPAGVGRHTGLFAEAERVVTHLFDSLDLAYTGWQWAVTVARAPRAKLVTVSEIVLLPGPGALLAPAWVPWQDRLRPGDLGVGDLMPAAVDDERLVPVLAVDGDDDAVTDWYQGDAALPGRSRVLSAAGRESASERWHDSDHGPHSPLARAAPARCASCGFFVSLNGDLGLLFGACANEYAPDDGRVVSLDHGCGAHSESAGATPSPGAQVPVIDELGYDLVDTAGVSMADTVFETLDHGVSQRGTVGGEAR